MKLILLGTGLSVALLIGISFFGCSDNEETVLASDDNNSTVIEALTPVDGSINVPITTSVTIAFSAPVDTLSIISNFHLAGGQQMHDWVDSLEYYGGFGMMDTDMNNHMMTWMDSIHIDGEFHWNDALDSCEFFPDSSLMPVTEYLCLLYEGGMHDNHGGMMGGTNHNDNGFHMFGFTTGP